MATEKVDANPSPSTLVEEILSSLQKSFLTLNFGTRYDEPETIDFDGLRAHLRGLVFTDPAPEFGFFPKIDFFPRN